MKQERNSVVPETASSLARVPGYLSVREVARILELSERGVYGYIEDGRLPGERIGSIIVVREEDLEGFERKAPGRLRVTPPTWHLPPQKNRLYLTTITVRVRPGQGEALEHKLAEMRGGHKHPFPGTAARYQQDPDEIAMTLVWRGAVMPAEEARGAALAAFVTDFEEVLDWETAVVKEGQALLHA